MSIDTFFEEAQATGEAARSGGRPMLLPRNSDVRVAYDRASSYAELLAEKDYIWRWKMRYLARGMAENEDLSLLAAGEVYTTGFGRGDLSENRASGKRLDIIVERALDRMGISEKADYGTAVHSFTAPNFGPVPDRVQTDVDAYWQCVNSHGVEILENEIFVACDEIRVAGTFDELALHPEYGYCISDKKTGKLNAGFGVQEACYVHGERYDTDTDERSPIHTDLNTEIGLIFAINDGKCVMHTVDIRKGWKVAKSIHTAKTNFNMKMFTKVANPSSGRVTVQAMLKQCQNVDEMNAVWKKTKAGWTKADKKYAIKRRKELEAK